MSFIDDINKETFVYYKGSQLLCAEGIIQWSFASFFGYCAAAAAFQLKIQFAIFTIPLVLILFLYLSKRMHYFGLSATYLIVKNQTKFWRLNAYSLSDIKEIVFEQQFKMPVAIRIITNDFESKLYPAASLWDKRWRELRDDLKNKNIEVRVECSIG